MQRFRNQFVLAASLLVLIAGWQIVAVSEDKPAAAGHEGHMAHGPFDACARACASCMVECESCYAHCAGLVAGGKSDHKDSMLNCNDCADLCRVAATLSARSSQYSAAVCQTCAEACDKCAAACKVFKDDEHMQACAKSCVDCAAACRAMIEQAGHAAHH